jgi:hypothetical protein
MAATARAVDLSDVKEGGGAFKPRRKPEGDYRAKFVKADDHIKEGKEPGWVMTVMVEGDNRSTYPVYLNPEKKQAWKIAQACRAAGLKVPTGRVRFDPNKLVNKEIGVFLEEDEYDGRPKSAVGEMFPASEVGANADEPDEEEIIDEDEEIEEEPEVEDEEEEEPEPPKRTTKTRGTTTVTKRRKPEPEPEEDEDEEEEDEEEPPPPPRRRTPAKKVAAAPPRRRKPAPVVEEDEDEDLDLDDLDD